MDIVLILLGLFFLLSVRYRHVGFDSSYLDRHTTATINGFFIALVFFSHFSTYLPDQSSLFFLSSIWLAKQRQLIVTTFMLFSGFGIMEQIQKRGRAYIDTFPKKRFLNVWVRLAAAVTVFLVVDIFLLHKHYVIKQFLTAYIGYSSVGNSNWYIFTILCMYILTYLAFKPFNYGNYKVPMTVLAAELVLFCSFAYQYLPGRFYNTVLCYFAGMVFSLYRRSFEQYINRDTTTYLITLLLVAIAFCVTYILAGRNTGVWGQLWFQLMGLFFAFTFVVLAMRFKITNPVFHYMGGSAMFALYMLQRLPMMLLSRTGIINHTLVFMLVAAIITGVIGWIFDFFINKLLKKVLA